MLLRYLCAFVLLVNSLTALSQTVNKLPVPTNQAQALINTFEIMCNLEPPNFERIDAHAAAMRMHLLSDNNVVLPNNVTSHKKAWAGNLTTGPFSLLIEELSGESGNGTSCAIVGGVPDVDAFRAEVVDELKIAPFPFPTFRGNSRAFISTDYGHDGYTLIVVDFKPIGSTDVMIQLISAQKHP